MSERDDRALEGAFKRWERPTMVVAKLDVRRWEHSRKVKVVVTVGLLGATIITWTDWPFLSHAIAVGTNLIWLWET